MKQHRLSNKNIEAGTGTCAVCGPVKLYHRKHRNEYVCATKRSNDEKARIRRGANGKWDEILGGRKYGEVADELFEAQGGRCPICKDSLTDTIPHLDHDHNTNTIRGLLCGRCNVGLGMFRDNPVALRKAIEYLKVAQ